MFKFLCTLRRWLYCQRFSANHTSNISITAINSLDLNFYFSGSFRHSHVGLAELNGSREVFIQDGDFASGVVAWQAVIEALLLLNWVEKFNPELQVGIPLIIVNNWDLDLQLDISYSKLKMLIDLFVVLRRDCCVIASSNTNKHLLVQFLLHNCNFNMSIALRD